MPLPDSGIPEPVRHFLVAHFHSIEQIEVLFLLRDTALREWSAAEISRELRSSDMSIQDRLIDLAASGFISARDADTGLVYRYAPLDDGISRLIDGLASAYKERRLRVINLIYAKPESDALSFSEAFNLSRKKGDE